MSEYNDVVLSCDEWDRLQEEHDNLVAEVESLKQVIESMPPERIKDLITIKKLSEENKQLKEALNKKCRKCGYDMDKVGEYYKCGDCGSIKSIGGYAE